MKTGVSFLITFLFIFPCTHVGGNDNYLGGSNAAAMGNAMVANYGFWSVFHNQAGLAGLQGTTLGFHRENRFLVTEYALSSIAVAIPVRPGTLALGMTYFGYSKYHEIKSGLSFSRQLTEHLAAGVQLNYHRLHISGHYGNSQHLSVEGGIIVKPSRDFLIGIHVFNPTRSAIKTWYEMPNPLIIRFGMGYHFGTRAFLNVETEKESRQRAVFRAGTELMVIDQLVIRAGINVHPVQSSFGIGYRHAGLSIDLAFTNHQILGLTPHFSTSLSFQ